MLTQHLSCRQRTHALAQKRISSVAVHVVGAGSQGSVVLMLGHHHQWYCTYITYIHIVHILARHLVMAYANPVYCFTNISWFYTADLTHSTGCGGVCCAIHPHLISSQFVKGK